MKEINMAELLPKVTVNDKIIFLAEELYDRCVLPYQEKFHTYIEFQSVYTNPNLLEYSDLCIKYLLSQDPCRLTDYIDVLLTVLEGDPKNTKDRLKAEHYLRQALLTNKLQSDYLTYKKKRR